MGGINDVQLQPIPGRLVTAVGFTNDMFFLFCPAPVGRAADSTSVGGGRFAYLEHATSSEDIPVR